MKYLPLPSQARLKELFDYNEDTGVFRWKKRANNKSRVTIGDIAGCSDGKYIRLSVDGKKYAAQRLAWMYMTGEDPGELEIDHKDEKKLNNAFSNLRKATSGQNRSNQGARKPNKLGIKGVKKKGNIYEARIKKNGKTRHLGCYKTPEEAHKAYCEAADKYFGEFANYG